MYKTSGIIIKKSDLGEIDRLITIYTPNFGKLVLKAKSVRKNQAKLKGHLELFLYSYLLVAPGRGYDIITGAETIESFSLLHNSLASLSAAFYFSELIDKLIVGPEKDERIWQLLLESFSILNRSVIASKRGLPTGDLCPYGISPEGMTKGDNPVDYNEIKQLIDNFERKLLEILGYGNQQSNRLGFIENLANSEIKSHKLLTRFM